MHVTLKRLTGYFLQLAEFNTNGRVYIIAQYTFKTEATIISGVKNKVEPKLLRKPPTFPVPCEALSLKQSALDRTPLHSNAPHLCQ